MRVGNIEAQSGQIEKGMLHVGELADGCTPIQIPVVIVNGVNDGPIAYLHAGSHGQETIYAIDMMRRLVHEELDPRHLHGAVILVPAANLLAHHAASRIAPSYGIREGVPSGGDLHKLWPGDASGSTTQRIAHTIWTQIVSQADFVVDYHTNSSPGIAFTLLYEHADRAESQRDVDVWRRTGELAGAFSLTIVQGRSTPNALSGASMLAGKPAIMVEMPSPRVLAGNLVACAIRGTKNVLAHTGIIDCSIEPQADLPVIPGEHFILPSIRANRGGVIRFEIAPGVLCPAGTVIARICDVFGDETEAIRMPEDGYVSTFPALSWVGAQAIASGDYVADCFS